MTDARPGLPSPARSASSRGTVAEAVVVYVEFAGCGCCVRFRCPWCSTDRRPKFHAHGAPRAPIAGSFGTRVSHCNRYDGVYELRLREPEVAA
jgi:hypothetical protein